MKQCELSLKEQLLPFRRVSLEASGYFAGCSWQLCLRATVHLVVHVPRSPAIQIIRFVDLCL